MTHKEKDDYILRLQRDVENLREVVSMYSDKLETLKGNSATRANIGDAEFVKNENGVISIYELNGDCLIVEMEDEVIKFVNTPYSVRTQKT